MTLRPHLRRSTTSAPRSASPATPAGAEPPGSRVHLVHRTGAVLVATVIAVFGVLGFAGGLDFFSTEGERILGLSSNGLLSTISLVTAAVLVGAALSGPRIASTVMIVVGVLFLVSALANLAVLQTELNFLAFRLSNVVFSVIAGFLLLVLGTYGRVSGNLPSDSPYARRVDGDDPDGADEFPSTPAEFAAEKAMRAAETAVVQHVASAEQRRRVEAMAQVRSRSERRRVWMSFDGRP
ncbi:DUF4383 domain-containing protein [Blastococcus sp. LR1]|uniref:DUF4383 domain-containing protein n=1 Tax=Blastococcus sp. LR1 TaxID=2877000 RepID=UPI001CCDEDB3|nr:DUF4383 domain-containing protein [Blastococcus sp. LR1]MCA0144111.1 DUF4383 domain-containing protein [Blastococcus sp. LR1]